MRNKLDAALKASESAWPRAWRDTRSAVTTRFGAVVVLVVTAAVAAGITTPYASNSHPSTLKALVASVAVVAGFVTGVGALLAYFLAVTPVRQRNERIRDLEAELEDYRPSEDPQHGQPAWVGGCEWSTDPPGVLLTLRRDPETPRLAGLACHVRRVFDGEHFGAQRIFLADKQGGLSALQYGVLPSTEFDPDRYSTLFPQDFPGVAIVVAPGVYEVRWKEVRGLGFTLLADPYTFEMWNGEVRNCGPNHASERPGGGGAGPALSEVEDSGDLPRPPAGTSELEPPAHGG